MAESRLLKIKVAGRFIDLLGHQMYGGPVPAVAEFVANAWDADAKKVEINIPEDVNSEYAEILVRDFGEGMTFDELNEYYLKIGYERRKGGREKTASGRLVMGRKGIGKLAGFGIAEDIVLQSVKDKHLVSFTLNYNTLKSLEEIQDFEFEPEIDEPSEEQNGVTVILKNLTLTRNINIGSFRTSLSRRFALNTDEMEININGVLMSKENLDLELRFPEGEGGWASESIPDYGDVRYWFGFMNDTIKDKELRGVSVFARERVAQFTPFFFNLSGGITGQVGLEYLTGQVKAENIDAEVDHIATPRQTVNWQFGNAPILEKWGQEKIKKLCKDWKSNKDRINLDRFTHQLSEFYPRIENLPPTERGDLTTALEKIAKLERISPNDFNVIANSMISGVERESVKKVIRSINTASENALPELWDAINEWDIISAVSTAEVIFGKIEIIKQFEKHIDNRLPEKAKSGELDMQDFIKNHPWLLGYQYERLGPADFHHEHGVDKWIEEEIINTNKEYKHEDDREGRRFDLLCIKSDRQIVILELMRPNETMDYDHVMRLNRYITRIQDAISQKGTDISFKSKTVYGLLIADKHTKDTSLGPTIQKLRDILDVITWKALFEQVQAQYKEYFKILQAKAPDDPRMKGFVNLD